MIDDTTRLLGRLSNNLAFVTQAAKQETQSFKHIQLIWLSPRTGVAIVVTSLGVAAQSLFELRSRGTTPTTLTRLSNALNARFANRPMREMTRERRLRARARRGQSR